MKMYYIAHTRGCNFTLLEKRGFITMYPAVDDYVFLEDREDYLPLLRRQAELGVSFLTHGKTFVKITEEDLGKMQVRSTDLITVGSEVLALIGVCENLEGIVQSRQGDKVTVLFKGLRRNYLREVERSEVVSKEQLDKLPATLRDEQLLTA